VLAQTSRKFGALPSDRLGILDPCVAVDFDSACALRLILAAGDLDEDDQWEDVPVSPRGADQKAPTKKHPKSRTIYY